MRVWAVSDIHVDFQDNERWIFNLSDLDYKDDILLLAGDVCHRFGHLQETLLHLDKKFRQVFFTPGNHDLWIREQNFDNSLAKLKAILNFCETSGIAGGPKDFDGLRIVPLLSWYSQPSEGDDSLYWPKPGEDAGNRMWSDNYFIKWPNSDRAVKASEHLAAMNELPEPPADKAMIISMSHFIPRKEMMFSEYPPRIDPERIRKYDRNPQFNFSRVAGSTIIEEQIRRVGAQLHVYGHQHINRDRTIDGVRYIAHCLGYPNERKRGLVRGIEQGLKLIWNTDGVPA